MKTWSARLLGWCCCLWFVVLLASTWVIPSQAIWGVEGGETIDTNPKNREVKVTATMPDVVPPSTPFLITPENEALLTVNRPLFSWYGSTDNVALSHYQIWLDGVLWFDNLPLISSSTSSYTLTYLASTDIYEFTPSATLTDGLHTWKVIIYDTASNYSESATWSFTVDTQAPIFIVTQLGDVEVTVTSQDNSTIPDDPIQLTDNEPTIKGTGEIGAFVHLDVIIPDRGNPSYEFTIDATGNWQVTLPTLPRDTLITLRFVITDEAGNISVLSGLKFIIVTQVLVIPAELITPGETPDITPAPVLWPKLLPPSISSRMPTISIPLVSPREIFIQASQRLLESLPPGVRKLLISGFAPIQALLKNQPWLFNILALIALLTPAITASIILAKQFGEDISPGHLREIWRGLGLWPGFKPQGLVIDSKTGQGLGFALVKLVGLDEKQASTNIFKITNQDGVYDQFQPHAGEYRMHTEQKGYTFPTLTHLQPAFNYADWYAGQNFKVNKDIFEPGLIIPLDLKPKLSGREKRRMNSRQVWLMLASLTGPLVLAHLSLCLILTIIWPSIWNLVAIGIYSLSFFRNSIKQTKQSLRGQLLTTQKTPVPTAGLVIQTPAGLVLDALFSSHTGHFQSFASVPSNAVMRIIKPGFLVAKEGHLQPSRTYQLSSSSTNRNNSLIIMSSSH